MIFAMLLWLHLKKRVFTVYMNNESSIFQKLECSSYIDEFIFGIREFL